MTANGDQVAPPKRRRVLRWLIGGLLALVLGEVLLLVTLVYRANSECCQTPFAANVRFSVAEVFRAVSFHAQSGQDRWLVQQVYPDLRGGYFLDVGSGDGVVNSNTRVLEDRGWTGLCIDPFPTHMEGRRCTVSRSVVFSKEGEVVRFRKSGELGGIEDTLDRWKDQAMQSDFEEFTTTTLTKLLDETGAPRFIHYMSLDIEGAELAALEGFDFDRYQVGAMTIEHNFEEPKRSQLRALLEKHGYKLARTIAQDDCYLLAR